MLFSAKYVLTAVSDLCYIDHINKGDTEMTKFIVHIEYANGKDGEREYPTRQDAEIEAAQMRQQENVGSATVEEVEAV
mgnify:FL=1